MFTRFAIVSAGVAQWSPALHRICVDSEHGLRYHKGSGYPVRVLKLTAIEVIQTIQCSIRMEITDVQVQLFLGEWDDSRPLLEGRCFVLAGPFALEPGHCGQPALVHSRTHTSAECDIPREFALQVSWSFFLDYWAPPQVSWIELDMYIVAWSTWTEA